MAPQNALGTGQGAPEHERHRKTPSVQDKGDPAHERHRKTPSVQDKGDPAHERHRKTPSVQDKGLRRTNGTAKRPRYRTRGSGARTAEQTSEVRGATICTADCLLGHGPRQVRHWYMGKPSGIPTGIISAVGTREHHLRYEPRLKRHLVQEYGLRCTNMVPKQSWHTGKAFKVRIQGKKQSEKVRWHI